MLIDLLIMVIVFGLLFYLVGMLPIAQPFKTAAQVILIIIAIVFLLGYMPFPHQHWRY